MTDQPDLLNDPRIAHVPAWFRRKMIWLAELFPSFTLTWGRVSAYWEELRRFPKAVATEGMNVSRRGRGEWFPSADVMVTNARTAWAREQEQGRDDQYRERLRCPELPEADPEPDPSDELQHKFWRLRQAHRRGEVTDVELRHAYMRALGVSDKILDDSPERVADALAEKMAV